MSVSDRSKKWQLGVVLFLCLVLVAILVALRPDPVVTEIERPNATITVVQTDEGPREIRTGHVLRTAPSGAIKRTTSTAENMNPIEAAVLRPMEGFIIDDLRGWKSIPANYLSENLKLSGGGITLADVDLESSVPAQGWLESPPLRLRLPAMSAPADRTAELPEGGEIALEVSLSADGEYWTGWKPARMHQPPDGNLVTPMTKPYLTPGTTNVLELPQTSNVDRESSGPWVQYRLSLTARSVAPVIRDVRVWRHRVD